MSLTTALRPAVAGEALLMLEQMRDGAAPARRMTVRAMARSRTEADLADLRTIARLCNLPRPLFGSSVFGIVGTFDGPDEAIVASVWEWCDAFALKPWFQAPGSLVVRGRSVACPGCIVMHAEVRGLPFTVGGRLVEPQAVSS